MVTLIHPLRHAPRSLALRSVLTGAAILVTFGFHSGGEPDRDILYTSLSEGQAERIWRMGPDGSELGP